MRGLIRVPEAATEVVVRRRCVWCGHRMVHIHQHQRERGVVDFRLSTVHQVRVRCPECGKTGTCRPEGLRAGRHRTDRVRAFGILLYVLGLSYGGAAKALRCLVGTGSKATVYRDVQEAGEKARQIHQKSKGRVVRIAGVDATGQRMKGRSVGVAFAVDAEHQVLLDVQITDEEDERQIREFLQQLSRDYALEMVITDELNTYGKAMRCGSVAADHRLCEAHWKRSKGLRIEALLAEAKRLGYPRARRDLLELRRLVRKRPPDAAKRIRTIHERYLHCLGPPKGGTWGLGYSLRMLTLHLLETWDQVGTPTQRTNNTAERLIGLLLKIRSKTMRGFVHTENLLRFVHLAAYLWENRRNCELKAVC